MVTRIHPYNAVDATPGASLAADIDQTNNAINAHEANTSTSHGVTGAAVGTTNSQTLSNKTLYNPIITGSISNAALKYEAMAASATAAVTTVIIGVTSTAAARTVTLPTAEIIKAGRVFIIQDESGVCGNAFNITVATEGAETINGQATIDIVDNYGYLVLYSNGTNLFVAASS